MNEDPIAIARLQDKLSGLMERQEAFTKEIEELRLELDALKNQAVPETLTVAAEAVSEKPQEGTIPILRTPLNAEEKAPSQEEPKLWKEMAEDEEKPGKIPEFRSNLEKFIGENLINKIGIVILVIGVGIGAKYAIEHDLISPWTRIILGYVLGLGLLGFAVRLKKQYENFSSVLLSGSMAIMYFITFAAYSFYSLIPSVLAFALMVMFTIFTVIAAISYNRQVIAHIGLVGAYAVPVLLSDGSGRVVILFTYMAIINAGILAIAVQKYWKPLYYSSFLLSWAIFITWFVPKYEDANHFGLAWIFISVFFVTFYIIFLAYKLVKKEKFGIDDIILLLANSSVFYGLGYALLYYRLGGEEYLGLWTLGNALINFVASILIFRQKEHDRNLFYFSAALVITFLTIAIPVQLEGNWVTLFWSVEAALLFWIGRTKNGAPYELLSYPLMALAFFSVVTHWPELYHMLKNLPEGGKIMPVFNMNFLTSMFFVASFGFIEIINVNKRFVSPLSEREDLLRTMDFVIPSMLLLVLYLSFYMEISTYWNQQPDNYNIPRYKTISILLYSMLFVSLLSFVNIYRLQKSLLGLINLGFSLAVAGLFLSLGLIAIGALRETYLGKEVSEAVYRGSMLIGIRYVCFGFLGLMLFTVYRYVHSEFIGANLGIEFDIFLHIVLLTVLSNELINWMDLSGSEQSYKLGLSILFGVYSLLLIILGIWKKKLHLRIGAIVLFSLTLLKLFFYDLSSLDTIAKTIVFVVLGILLLIISFLYAKYKHVIFEEAKDE